VSFGEDPPDLSLAEVINVLDETQDQPHRASFLDPNGVERAWLSGLLIFEKDGDWLRLSVTGGAGLSGTLTILLDGDTRCVVEEDGTMTCTLPSRARWITTPLVEGG